MRPAAKVHEVARAVEGDGFGGLGFGFGVGELFASAERVRRDVVQQFDLAPLAVGFHPLSRLAERHGFALERRAFGDEAGHFGFDLHQVFVRDPFRKVEIVVEPVLNGRTDAEACRRAVQPAHGSRHDMSGRVAQNRKGLVAFVGQDLEVVGGVCLQPRPQIHQLAAQPGSDGGLGQA